MSELRFFLEPAPGEEANIANGERQAPLREVLQTWRDNGLNPSPSVFTQDAIGGDSWLLGEFLLENSAAIKDWVDILSPLGAYLAGRNGRKVRAKSGDQEFEATTVEEIERLHALLNGEKGTSRSPGDNGSEE